MLAIFALIMRMTFTAASYRWKQLLIVVLLVVLDFRISASSRCTAETLTENDLEIKKIKSVWAERTANLDSVIIKANIEDVLIGTGGDEINSADPFSEMQPKIDKVSKVAIEFLYKNGLTRINRNTDQATDPEDHTRSVLQTYSASFNGQKNFEFVGQGTALMGEINIQSSPSSDLSTHVDFLPIALWLQPKEVFDATNWIWRDMKLSNGSYDIDGINCQRIEVPRKKVSCLSRNWNFPG